MRKIQKAISYWGSEKESGDKRKKFFHVKRKIPK